MTKPRTKKGIQFPFIFEKNGRTGRIKKWDSGKFGTYFVFGFQKFRNTFNSFESAYEYLEKEFSKLDTDKANSRALNPLNGDIEKYSELEQVLREKGSGASLREAVDFYLAHHHHKKFAPLAVKVCVEKFLQHMADKQAAPSRLTGLKKDFRRFGEDFGTRKIHEIPAQEISHWLLNIRGSDGEKWGPKTVRNVRGSLVQLATYAKRHLNAIPETVETEFQKVENPQLGERKEVEIYTPAEIQHLLYTACVFDIELIPGIVVGCFEGLRPDEFHAENVDRTKRAPIGWDALNWNDSILHVKGQKVRSKATRDVPLHDVTKAWLEPFKHLEGEIWKYKKAYNERMLALFTAANLDRRYDAFRHSYASYRIRQMKGDLAHLASEMGNSPAEIINSYKRNVTDKQAAEWFAIKTPPRYVEEIQKRLKK